MNRLASLAALPLIASSLCAQTSAGHPGNCGLIYGDSHAISICAPSGWVLDNSVLNDKGIYAVFYRQELSYETAKAHASIMYINVLMKRDGRNSANELRKIDIADTEQHEPQTKVAQEAPVTIPANAGAPARVIPVESFSNAYGPSWEAVAYVEDEKTISIVVLTSANESSFNSDHSSFVDLLHSYKFLGSNVTIKK
jgi:hypothetical protein